MNLPKKGTGIHIDLETGRLIQDDMLVSIRIAEGRGSRAFIYGRKGMPINGGVLEYSYTFENSGMHDIFFDFKFANDPEQKIHELPDFLIDVQKPVAENAVDTKYLILSISEKS